MQLPEVLARPAATSDDGSLWVAHLRDDDVVALVVKVQELMTGSLDELFLRHVVDVIGRLGLPGVLVAVARRDGRVRRVDRRFRHELERRLADTPTRFRGLFVVGPSASRAVTTTRSKPVDG